MTNPENTSMMINRKVLRKLNIISKVDGISPSNIINNYIDNDEKVKEIMRVSE